MRLVAITRRTADAVLRAAAKPRLAITRRTADAVLRAAAKPRLAITRRTADAVLRAAAKPRLAITRRTADAVLRAAAKPRLAITRRTADAVLRAAAKPRLAIARRTADAVLRAAAKPRLAIALVVGTAAGAAIADDRSPPNTEPTLAEAWVGTWTGKVKWKECSLETGPTLSMPIQALGGVLTSDGDLLYEGLGALTWSQSGKQLTLTREGIAIWLTPGKKGAVALNMSTQSGCVATATLKRATSGIASCDSVRALATVKSTCDGLDETTRDDDLEAVDQAWKGWKKLKGKKKKAQTKLCTARLPELRADVASCQPGGAAVVVVGTGCTGLTAALDKLMQCSALPQDQRQMLKDAFDQIKGNVTILGDAQCDQVLVQLRDTFAAMGCPI